MLSLRLWRELDFIPAYPVLHRVFIPKTSSLFPKFFIEFTGLSTFCLCTAFPFIVLPIVIVFSCLSTTLHIAATLARHHEMERYDLIALTPIGVLGTALEVSRIHSKGLRENIEVARSFGGALAAFLLNCGVLTFMASLNNTQPQYSNFPMLILLMGFLLMLVAFYHDCRQSLVLGVVIGIFASSAQERMTARLWAFGVYLVIQVALYSLSGMLFALFTALFGRMLVIGVDVNLVGAILLALIGHFIAREIVIRLLWRRLTEHINDDLRSIVTKQIVSG